MSVVCVCGLVFKSAMTKTLDEDMNKSSLAKKTLRTHSAGYPGTAIGHPHQPVASIYDSLEIQQRLGSQQ